MNETLKDLQDRLTDWFDSLHFSRVQKRSLVIVALIVCLISGALVFRGNSQSVAIAPPVAISAPQLVTVDIAGGVNKPGVYSIATSSRVIDAINAAGGAKTGADLSDINLARIVKDGEQIYVTPVAVGSKSAATSMPAKKMGPININRASLREFDSLPGIGPVLAMRIFTYRKVYGPFTSIEDLQKVSGIGSAKFAELKSKVRV